MVNDLIHLNSSPATHIIWFFFISPLIFLKKKFNSNRRWTYQDTFMFCTSCISTQSNGRMKGWPDSANSPLRMDGIGISLPIQIQSSFKPRSRATISTPFLNQRTLVLLSFFELCSVSLGHLRSQFYISTFLLFFSECIICSLLVCNFYENEVITLSTDSN